MLVETKARVGVFAIALGAYLPQFPQLVPEFEAQYAKFKTRIPDSVELIDGVFYDMAAPSKIHQTVLLEMTMQLYPCVKGHPGCQIFFAPVDVIFLHAIYLYTRILGVNLPFHEGLVNFWYPNKEANLIASRGNLEAQMLLDTARMFKLVAIAQNTMKRSEKLFGAEFLFVVVFRNLKHQKHRIHVKDFETVNLFVVAVSQECKDKNNRNPDNRRRKKMNNVLHTIILA